MGAIHYYLLVTRFYPLSKDDLSGHDSKYITIAAANIITAFLVLLLWIIFLPDHDDIVFEKYNTTKIHSTAGSQNSISGTFYLGTGVIESKEVYLGNIETQFQGKTAYARVEIPVKETIRVVDDNLSNYAIYKEPLCKFRKDIFNSFNIYEKRLAHSFKCLPKIRKEHPPLLHVHKNSVIHQLSFQ